MPDWHLLIDPRRAKARPTKIREWRYTRDNVGRPLGRQLLYLSLYKAKMDGWVMSWNDLRKGRLSQCGGEYFITFTTFKRQVLFDDFDLARVFCQQIALNEQACSCRWFTWVLMPDHFHGLLRLGGSGIDLSSVVGRLKGSSAYALNRCKGKSSKVWQPSFYDIALRHEDNRKEIARYIVANPLRKMLTQSVKNYPYWNSDFL